MTPELASGLAEHSQCSLDTDCKLFCCHSLIHTVCFFFTNTRRRERRQGKVEELVQVRTSSIWVLLHLWFIYLNAVVLPVIMPLIYIYEPVAGVGRNTRGKNVLSKDIELCPDKEQFQLWPRGFWILEGGCWRQIKVAVGRKPGKIPHVGKMSVCWS